MHSTLRRAAPYLPARERDRAINGLGAGMFSARHGTICILQTGASPSPKRTQAANEPIQVAYVLRGCLSETLAGQERPPGRGQKRRGPTGFILRGIVDW